MTAEERVALLKKDLGKLNADDALLASMLEQAEEAIMRTGIKNDGSTTFDWLVIWQAAYVFRKRGSSDTKKPEYLKDAINSMLFSQKGRGVV